MAKIVYALETIKNESLRSRVALPADWKVLLADLTPDWPILVTLWSIVISWIK